MPNDPAAARFTACTVPTPNIAAAEECAIAVAIVRITASGTPSTIVTDSQDAYRTISNGLGSPHTLADPVDRPVSPDLHCHPLLTYSDILHYYRETPTTRRSNCGWSAWLWTRRHRWPALTRAPGCRVVRDPEDLAVLTRVAEAPAGAHR
ncbi:hypothetical protein HPB48_008894 [Haemaphysalis longicornis]|uniref:Uncharacterized protein n=1 Tax=Haemaphysalis longicornis TaxID=44386 RepID=A0A9J6H1Y1_HAELO|nr:hypothetical protein HPB48_008894 [Haemaphysalis longicornis]